MGETRKYNFQTTRKLWWIILSGKQIWSFWSPTIMYKWRRFERPYLLSKRPLYEKITLRLVRNTKGRTRWSSNEGVFPWVSKSVDSEGTHIYLQVPFFCIHFGVLNNYNNIWSMRWCLSTEVFCCICYIFPWYFILVHIVGSLVFTNWGRLSHWLLDKKLGEQRHHCKIQGTTFVALYDLSMSHMIFVSYVTDKA